MGRSKGKLSKGQPAGQRSASGRKRDRTPRIVGPCEGIMRRREMYGAPSNDNETFDALGRAWRAGLLHNDPTRAKALLDGGRKFQGQYWYTLGVVSSDSLAKFQPSAPRMTLDPVVEKIREDAFHVALAMVDARGRSVRKYFDHLVTDHNFDCGPPWLDRIIFAHRRGGRSSEQDYAWLKLALEGLEQIA